MNIAHVISSIDNSTGGPSRSVTHLLDLLAIEYPKLQLQLHTANTKNPILKEFRDNSVTLSFYKREILGRLSDLSQVLLQSNIDLYHGQAIWDLPIHQMAKVARKREKPYIISPRGMLEPWSLNQRKTKKQIALALYQYKDLKDATCLHATATMEAENIRALGFKNPIAVIPNGIPLSEFEVKKYKNERITKKLLFLSRVVENKGVLELIEAWSQIPNSYRNDWIIEIVGNGDQKYIDKLKGLIENKGLKNKIEFKGPLYGKEKIKAYHEATLFVLPTYSENFGIVVAEALACGTPVITTTGAPWQDLLNNQCGWWINPDKESLKKCLLEVLEISQEQLFTMGLNGRKLIEEKYSMQAVGMSMFKLYEWILNTGDKPAFINEY